MKIKKLKKYKKKLAFCKSLSYNISCVKENAKNIRDAPLAQLVEQ